MAATIIPTIALNQEAQLKVSGMLGDLETAFDNLQVFHSIMIDQLCEHTPADAESSMQLNDRFYVLLDAVKNKIGQMSKTRDEISTYLLSFR